MKPVSFDQVLTLLPEGLRQGRRVSLTVIGNHLAQSCVQRLTLAGKADSLNLVVKRVSQTEFTTHALLSQEVPHLVPRLHAAVEIKANDWLLFMEDLSVPGPEAAMDLTGMRSALRSLAEVHSRFANSRNRLRAAGLSTIGVNAPEVGRRLRQALDVLIAIGPLFDLTAERTRIAGEVALSLRSETIRLIKEPRHTLVHGDFHFGNVLRLSRTEVRISDWGCAAMQVPAWDLIMCSEDEVSYYLDHSKRGDGFFQDLRAAVLYRMAEFIIAGTRLLFASPVRIADTLPLCIDRLIEAATAMEFRGGRGVHFPRVLGQSQEGSLRDTARSPRETTGLES